MPSSRATRKGIKWSKSVAAAEHAVSELRALRGRLLD
jgi:hypothetical protein